MHAAITLAWEHWEALPYGKVHKRSIIESETVSLHLHQSAIGRTSSFFKNHEKLPTMTLI